MSPSLPLSLRPWRRTCPVPAPPGATVTVRHPLCARLYARQAERAETLGLADRRTALLADLSGRVIEIGAGTGTNLRHYPAEVAEVVAVEPEPYLRTRLLDATASAAPTVTVLDAAAERLPFDDGSFDAAVSSLVLCSVEDPARALAELARVLRPGGQLRFLEHVASPHAARRRAQRLADATLWPRLSGGCHLGRDTTALLEAAGLAIEREERFAFGIPPLDPPKTHVLGLARRA
jgi:ubiquinone/menaquinone biosynthesis C-methylase UbiE